MIIPAFRCRKQIFLEQWAKLKTEGCKDGSKAEKACIADVCSYRHQYEVPGQVAFVCGCSCH